MVVIGFWVPILSRQVGARVFGVQAFQADGAIQPPPETPHGVARATLRASLHYLGAFSFSRDVFQRRVFQAGAPQIPSKFVLTFVYSCSAAHRLKGMAASSSTTGTARPSFVRSIVLM